MGDGKDDFREINGTIKLAEKDLFSHASGGNQ